MSQLLVVSQEQNKKHQDTYHGFEMSLPLVSPLTGASRFLSMSSRCFCVLGMLIVLSVPSSGAIKLLCKQVPEWRRIHNHQRLPCVCSHLPLCWVVDCCPPSPSIVVRDYSQEVVQTMTAVPSLLLPFIMARSHLSMSVMLSLPQSAVLIAVMMMTTTTTLPMRLG